MSAERAAPVAAGAAGFGFGLLFPAWHVAIEPAQVLAGIVSYPAGNPFGLYQERLWTLWHQLLALGLASGLEERTLAWGVSGLVGALAFAALAMFARACGATPAFALAAPFLVFLLNPVGWGFNYPILIVGHPHTYGMAGLSWVLLGVGLLGAGSWSAGAFVLGLAPAVHASLGVWVALVAGIAALADWRRLRPRLRALLRGGIPGLALAGTSLALHLAMQRPGPDVDPVEQARHLDAFFALWDAHRVGAGLDWRMLVLGLGAALAAARLLRRGGALGVGPALALRVQLGCAALGGVASILAAHGALPDALATAMPTRVANLAMIGLVPLVVGSLASAGGRLAAGALLVALVALSLVWAVAPALLLFGLPALVAASAALVASKGAPAAPARGTRLVEGLVAGGVLIGVGLVLYAAAGRGLPQLRDRTRDPVLAAAARGEGLLAVAPTVFGAQLLTRRPLALDPQALDMLPYAPAGGPELAHLLREIYGIDFFAPPPAALHGAVVPPQALAVWLRRSAQDWQEVGARTGVREVLIPSRWSLQLPVVARGDAFTLYRVPPPEPAEPG